MTERPRHRIVCLCFAMLLGRAVPGAAEEQQTYARKEGQAQLLLRGGTTLGDRVECRLSEQLLLTLSVEGSPGLEVKPPEKLVAEGWVIEPAAAAAEVTRLPDDRVRWLRRYTLEPLKPGEATLLLSALTYRDPRTGAEWKDVLWPGVPLRVTTEVASAELHELRDVGPPEALPPPPAPFPWMPIVGGGLVILVVLTVAWRFGERLLRPRESPLSAGQWATAELDRLDSLGLTAAGETERFHTLLSDVVRHYLDLRFQLRAGRQTTAEFLRSMHKESPLSAEQLDWLGDLFVRCDLAKFARVRPAPEECRATADLARNFVLQTTPTPPTALENAPAGRP